MTINKLQIVRTIQNASYNDSQVAELLLELGKFISDPELSLRMDYPHFNRHFPAS